MAHNTIHCATNAQRTAKKTGTTVLKDIHDSGAVLSPVSTLDRIQQRTEQVVDALDKKLTDSLWAVASNRDSKHKETRQATQVKSEDLINKVQDEIVQLVEDKQCPVQNPHYHTTRKAVYRLEAQSNVGHDTAMNHCAEKESVHPEK